MKLSLLCHWLLSRRRWLLLIPTMLITLLLDFVAPAWLFLLLLA